MQSSSWLSARLPTNLAPSALWQARSAVPNCLDMSHASAEAAGIQPEQLHVPCTGPDAWSAQQGPAGAQLARAALAASLQDWQQQSVSPADLYLTASSAQSYQLLFRLFGKPGDKVVLAAPAYPLLSGLIEQADLVPVRYELLWQHDRWQVEHASFAQALLGARFCLLVCPDHPTGACPDEQTLRFMSQSVAASQAIWIWDEVFAPYTGQREYWSRQCQLRQAQLERYASAPPITFSLGSMAKYAGLSGIKVSWLQLLSAPVAAKEAIAAGLLYLLDTDLTVATPMQQILPQALAQAPAVQRAIQSRLQCHRHELAQLLRPYPMLRWLQVDAGWMAVIQIPQYPDEETVITSLLQGQQVFVHPGYFYDFPRRGILVTSLLMPTQQWRLGWQRLLTGLRQLWPTEGAALPAPSKSC